MQYPPTLEEMTMSDNKEFTKIGMYKQDGKWFLTVDGIIVPVVEIVMLDIKVYKDIDESPIQSSLDKAAVAVMFDDISELVASLKP